MEKIKIKIKKEVKEAQGIQYIPAYKMIPDMWYVTINGALIKVKEEDIDFNNTLSFTTAKEKIIKCTCAHPETGTAFGCEYTGATPVIQNEELTKMLWNKFEKTKNKINVISIKYKNDKSNKNSFNTKKENYLNPITGCTKGSQGDILGAIMLENKCSPSTRALCIEKMRAALVKNFGFDDKKAKSLAQSWYSTLWTRKAHIYQKK